MVSHAMNSSEHCIGALALVHSLLHWFIIFCASLGQQSNHIACIMNDKKKQPRRNVKNEKQIRKETSRN